jgi:hypothetical protein
MSPYSPSYLIDDLGHLQSKPVSDMELIASLYLSGTLVLVPMR